MLQESDIVPYSLSHPLGERIVILAPHPDDETLGCGGTIRLLVKSSKQIKVIFLTSGDKADPFHKLSHKNPPLPHLGKWAKGGVPDGSHITEYALLREKEAVAALKVLGISDYEFHRFPDRGLHMHYKTALERLSGVAETYKSDTVYSPSMIELNPDHRTTAALSMEIQKMNKVRIVFYEITTPLRPNILVDVTSVYGSKKRALKKYKSQLKIKDYLKHITALNTFRSLTVDGPCEVEAFWCVDEPLSGEDIAKWLGY